MYGQTIEHVQQIAQSHDTPLYEKEAKNVADLLDLLESVVNGGGSGTYMVIAEYISTRFHRTLQQQVFSMFTALCKEWAEAHKDNRFDARNEYTCQMSKNIYNGLLDGFEGVPLI
jgi:hypothetical protein